MALAAAFAAGDELRYIDRKGKLYCSDAATRYLHSVTRRLFQISLHLAFRQKEWLPPAAKLEQRAFQVPAVAVRTVRIICLAALRRNCSSAF